MPKKLDLVGQKYGLLTVKKESNRDLHGNTVYECLCDCGKIHFVKTDNLRSGHTKSCGCYRNKVTSERSKRHCESKKRLYRIWAGVHSRCRNTNVKIYKHYGGRGIRVCDEWNSFEPFRDWALTHGYTDELTIDRIDVNGNYEPSNCRWIPKTEQSKNRRCCKQNPD